MTLNLDFVCSGSDCSSLGVKLCAVNEGAQKEIGQKVLTFKTERDRVIKCQELLKKGYVIKR